VGVVAAAIPFTSRRFAAALLLGVVGYGVALLFALFGAPDLALTQVLVETLSLVVFLLVLRHLPERDVPPPSWTPAALRIGLAVAVGVTVSAFALVVGTVRTPDDAPVAEEMTERSYEDAGGENVVNVILVDFRGIDTMGEITVLGIAAVGIASLVRGARRAGFRSGAAPPAEPSVILEQITRVVFPVALLVSLYITARGHNAPGGGFAGGLIAGCAFVLRHLAGGVPRFQRPWRMPSTSLIAIGLALAAVTAIVPIVAGQDALESAIVHVHPPLIGDVKLVSSAVFDLGVYVLVLGVVLSMLAHLGADDPQEGASPEPERMRS
jgi:multicomponent Na+:H+ antiporter subunit A